MGKDSSSTPDLKNNYFTETEDVEACGKGINAGISKPYDYMTTKEFYDELTAGGAKYQYVEGKTPVLPTKEYAADFEVIPADLKNVVIKVDGKEITSNTAMLTAGTYTVEVTADDCEPLSKEITISADIATHTQAFWLNTVKGQFLLQNSNHLQNRQLLNQQYRLHLWFRCQPA